MWQTLLNLLTFHRDFAYIAPDAAQLLADAGVRLVGIDYISAEQFGAPAPWVGFENYANVLTDPVFWAVVRRTVVFTAVSVIISVLLGLAIALLMRRVHRRVRLFMIVAMMFVWALPQLVAAQIFKWMTDADFGVVNYLIDKLPFVSFKNHSWFLSPTQGWIVITTLVVWARPSSRSPLPVRRPVASSKPCVGCDRCASPALRKSRITWKRSSAFKDLVRRVRRRWRAPLRVATGFPSGNSIDFSGGSL